MGLVHWQKDLSVGALPLIKKYFEQRFSSPPKPWVGWAVAFLVYCIFYGYQLHLPPTPYFDEIHYVKVAHHLLARSGHVGEAHPYFGLYLITLSIALFGDHPLAWRLSSFLAGFGVLAMTYLLSVRLLQSRRAAWIATLLLLFDGVFYTLARIALFNNIMLLMMLLSIYFLFKYALFEEWTRPKAFFLSGIASGLAVGTRWVALGLIFFYVPILIWVVSKKKNCLAFLNDFMLFFLLPASFVYVSMFFYIPFVKGYHISAIWRLQEAMVRFHSTLRDYDSRAASWWTWPLMLKPTWFYIRETGHVSVLAHHSISAIFCVGNPVIYWFLPVAVFLSCVWRSIPKKTTALLILGYLSQWLPWSLVARNQYFHYVHELMPFGVMILALVLDRLWSRFRWGRWAVLAYFMAVIALFIYWFPLLSGMNISYNYFQNHLWLDGWHP